MDPLDHLSVLPNGAPCSVCEEHVPASRVRLLAWREDLAFVQIDCPGCQSSTLGFAMSSDPAAATTAATQAITGDDVLDMHQFLARWDGDLGALLSADRAAPGRNERGRAGSSR